MIDIKIKILITKVGLDGHDRGAKLLCRFLRDAGMEVVYTGIRQTPEAIAQIALQEDVDIIGISILSGAHKILIPKVIKELNNNNIEIPILVGGIIPVSDVDFLLKTGVEKIYFPGTSFNQIKNDIHELFEKRSAYRLD